jgi:hypothetical protein
MACMIVLLYFSDILSLKISPTRLPAIIAATFTKVPNKGISFLLWVLISLCLLKSLRILARIVFLLIVMVFIFYRARLL